MDRPLPYFASSHFTTATCSFSQTGDIKEDCSLYCAEPITETGDPMQKSSLVTASMVTGVAATKNKSLLVTGRIEHKTLHHSTSSAAQKTTAQTATDP